MLYDENENLVHLSLALLLLFDGCLIFLLGCPLLVTPVLSLMLYDENENPVLILLFELLNVFNLKLRLYREMV